MSKNSKSRRDAKKKKGKRLKNSPKKHYGQLRYTYPSGVSDAMLRREQANAEMANAMATLLGPKEGNF